MNREKWQAFKDRAIHLKENVDTLPLEDFTALANEMLTAIQEEKEEDRRILH